MDINTIRLTSTTVITNASRSNPNVVLLIDNEDDSVSEAVVELRLSCELFPTNGKEG